MGDVDLAGKVVVEQADADTGLAGDVLQPDLVEGVVLELPAQRVLESLPGGPPALGCRLRRLLQHCVAAPGYSRPVTRAVRSEEHTSELQSLMRISYAVFC